MGDPAEGKKQFDKVIAEENRRPDLLIAVSELLREVGARSEARTMAEEAFDRATEQGVKRQAALARALVARDRADEVRWLEKADLAQPSVRALLAGARGRLARQQGDDEAAARHHREALKLLAALPESATTLSDRSAACLELYDVTGDAAELVRARRLLEQAAALRPGDRLLLHSRATSAVESGYRDLAAGTLDLGALRLRGRALDLDHLYDDRAGRDALHARAR